MICPVCKSPALSSERIGRYMWFTHAANVPNKGRAGWIMCVDMRSAQEVML